MRRLVSFGVLVAFGALVVGGAAPAAPDRGGAAVAPIAALEVRSIYTSEFDLARPRGIAYVPADRALVIAGADGGQTQLLRLSVFEDRLGVSRIEGVANRASLAFDGASARVTLVDRDSIVSVDAAKLRTARPDTTRSDAGSMRLQNPQGATFDAASGTWWVLDAGARELVGVGRGSTAPSTKISLRNVGGGRLQGIAGNPADGLLYVMSTEEDMLLGLDESGAVQATYSLAKLSLEDPQAIVFAPSADPTDDPATQHLYIADAGGASTVGRVVEATLTTAVAAAAVVDFPTQVQTIQTSLYSPSSPDPAGITYVPSTDRFIISDSEVDEMTIYQGANLYTATRTGAGTGTGTTLPSSKEPSDVGYDPTSGRLFTADDDGDKVSIFVPGPDGRHGTADDTITSFSTSAFGSPDAEGVEYDAVTGHVFVSDGVGIEVYDINPVDGVFGNGNDVVTHFDVAQFGSRDAEGIGIDRQNGHLLVIDPSTKSIYELTRSGGLVRVIDCRDIGLAGNRLFADVTVAPTSDPTDPPTTQNYWFVDRQVDNGADPNENDGLLYEVSAPSATSDLPPSVTLTAPAEGATVSGTVSVQATASDDVGVTQVAFSVDGTSIGIDTNGADGWSVVWSTTGSAEGQHTVNATAMDTAGQTASDSNAVTVDNVNGPPSVSVTQPVDGAHVRGIVAVVATASDDDGVSQVAFAVDGVGIGTDTNGADGWSVSWNTTAVTDGSHAVSATATDVTSQTASDSNGVTVDNTVPTVAVIAPTAGSTVEGTVVIQANASDNGSVASVQFLVDGSPIGTDTNGGDGWSASWDTRGYADGNHSVAAHAVDAAGNTATAATVAVAVDNPDVSVLNIPVATGVDDADELLAGTVRRNGGDLELGTDGTATTVGVRFAGVLVPRGATIVSASVQFTSDERGTTTSNLVVRAEAGDNAASFSTTAFNVSGRPRTTASVAWSPPSWDVVPRAGAGERTPDLSDVLQEVVDRAGWTSGNALAVLITGSGRRTAESFEGGAPALLRIEYSTGSGPPAAPPANVTPPTMTGAAEAGQTLNADRGTWSGGTPITYAYQWQRCDSAGGSCEDVAGATDASYALSEADVAQTIRVRVHATNAAGSASATSAPSGVVQPPSVDGLSEVAGSLIGSDEPTFFANSHRVAVTAGGRMLVVHGRHESGVQLAWRDVGGLWRTTTRGAVTDGGVLAGTGSGDWSASIVVASAPGGTQHAWIVWSADTPGSLPKPLQMRRLSELDDPAGPLVGPIVTLDGAASKPTRADIGFELAPDGSLRGCIVWARLVTGSQYDFVAAWFTDLSTDTPALQGTTALVTGSNFSRNPTVVSTATGLRVVARSATKNRLQIFNHSASAPLTTWSAGPTGVSANSSAIPSAVGLSSGAVLAAIESDSTAHIVTVQRFPASGTPSIDLQLTGYSMPTLASDGVDVWIVMIRASDGYVVSRTFSPLSGWSPTDRVEIGAEGGGNHSWPNALRETDGRLRFVVRGPSGDLDRAAVLAFQRPT